MSKGSDRRPENRLKIKTNWPWPDKVIHGNQKPDKREATKTSKAAGPQSI